MKVNLRKDINVRSCSEKIEFFKQFNIYETINCNEFIYSEEFFGNRYNMVKHRLMISKADATTPILEIKFAKLLDTIEGTSLEGQHLTGKKLILVGKIKFNLIICYYYTKNRFKYSIKSIKIPFSTFIIIPKDICMRDSVNLIYEIEDLSIVYLCKNKIFISVTPLIEYLDEYLDEEV